MKSERSRACEERKGRFLACLAQEGSTISASLGVAGVSSRALENWRVRDPEFRDREKQIRLRKVGGVFVGRDFVTFRQLYFGHETFLHHLKMVEAIESAPADSVTVIVAPPEGGKTTTMIDYYCWRLGEDPNTRICVISENQKLARKMGGLVQRRMTDREFFGPFIKAYGPFVLDRADKDRAESYDRDFRRPWNSDYFTVLKASHDEKDYSLEVKGAGSQIYGARYDLIVLDDVQSLKNLNQTEELLEYLRQDVITRLSANGKVVIVGTRIKEGDLFEALAADEDLVDQFVTIRAIDEAGRSYWPEQWPLERLERRRKKVGDTTWKRVYMQQPASAAGQTFGESVLQRCLDTSRVVGQRDAGSEMVCSIDPALVNWAGFATASFNADRLWLLDMEAFNHLGSNEGMMRHMQRIAAIYAPQTYLVEFDGQGRSLFEDTRLRELSEQFGFRVVKHETTGNKSEPVYGVTAMVSSMRRGEMVFPYGDARTRERVDPLLQELRRWRPDVPPKLLTQDRVIALWMVWSFWMQRRRSLKQAADAWRRDMPNFLLTGRKVAS